MKLSIEQTLNCAEPEIKITCGIIDGRLKKIIEAIRLYSFSVIGIKNGAEQPVSLESIYYFDSVDNKTFLYLEKDVLSCEKKLYELEELLCDTSFIRISKSCIVNTAMVKHASAQFSGRLDVTLENGEKVIVSKHYAKAFRDKFRS